MDGNYEQTIGYEHEQVGARAISVSELLGQVMFLVSIALGFLALLNLLGE